MTTTVRRQKSKAVAIAIVALYYTLAAQLAAAPIIEHAVNGGELENPFRDKATFIAVLKCAVIGFSVLFSLAQAAVYRFMLGFLSPETQLKFSRHWFFVLLGQLPYSVVVSVLFQINAPALEGLLVNTWFRSGVSVAASVIYMLCVARATDMGRKRATLCGIVVGCLNLALVFVLPASLVTGRDL